MIIISSFEVEEIYKMLRSGLCKKDVFNHPNLKNLSRRYKHKLWLEVMRNIQQ